MADPLHEKVIAIVAKKKKLPAEQLTAATTFAEIGVDSLDAMDLVFAFEDEFSISIPDDVVQRLASIGDVTAALQSALAERRPEAAS